MKEKLELLLELWSVPRYRAIIKLSLYFIFFAFVIAAIRSSYNANSGQSSAIKKDNPAYVEKFSSVITYNGKNYLHTLIGEEETLVIDDITYAVKANLLLSDVGTPTEEYVVKFWRFTPEVINELVKFSEIQYKTNFTNGDTETGYLVTMRKLFEQFNSGIPLRTGKDIDTENLKFNIKTEKGKTKKVTIDVTNYKDLFVENKNEEKIEILYK